MTAECHPPTPVETDIQVTLGMACLAARLDDAILSAQRTGAAWGTCVICAPSCWFSVPNTGLALLFTA